MRDVESWVVEWHRHQAKLRGETLESHMRKILTDAALAKKRAIAEEMRAGLDELRGKYGIFTDSAASIREDRDHRG